MTTAVDTNIFLGILIGGASEASLSRAALATCKSQGRLVTSVVCYAELARQFATRRDLDEFLREPECRVQPLDAAAAFLGGQYFMQYRARGGEKTRIIADFLIAADAQLNADRLLTNDRRFFGQNFPQLSVIGPDALPQS